MTKLERQLAETFRAARWEENHGRPVCPSCYDHRSVRPDTRTRSGPVGLHTYACCDCAARFSDISGTVLARSSSPLRTWAIALLMEAGRKDWQVVNHVTPSRERGTPHRDWAYHVGRAANLSAETLRVMQARWNQGSRLGPAWTRTLAESGLSLMDLLRVTPARKERPACSVK